MVRAAIPIRDKAAGVVLLVDIDLRRLAEWADKNCPEEVSASQLHKIAGVSKPTFYDWRKNGIFRGGDDAGKYERRSYSRADAIVAGIAGALVRKGASRDFIKEIACQVYDALEVAGDASSV